MEYIATGKVWRNEGNKQLLVTVPAKCGIQKGDLVQIKYIPSRSAEPSSVIEKEEPIDNIPIPKTTETKIKKDLIPEQPKEKSYLGKWLKVNYFSKIIHGRCISEAPLTIRYYDNDFKEKRIIISRNDVIDVEDEELL